MDGFQGWNGEDWGDAGHLVSVQKWDQALPVSKR